VIVFESTKIAIFTIILVIKAKFWKILM